MGKNNPAAAEDKGPDNNKRLAALEKGVAGLVAALEPLGIKPFPDQLGDFDPIGAAIDQLASKVVLHADLAELGQYLITSYGDEIEEGGAIKNAQRILVNLAASKDRLLAALKAHELQESNIEAMLLAAGIEREGDEAIDTAVERGFNSLVAKLTETEAALAAANKHPARGKGGAEAPAPSRRSARNLGRRFKGGSFDELARLVAGNAAFELVPSDGSGELLELDPVEVRGSHFLRKRGEHFLLNEPLFAKATADCRIDGFAVVFDGKQVAYAQLLEPLAMEPGIERKFEGLIV